MDSQRRDLLSDRRGAVPLRRPATAREQFWADIAQRLLGRPHWLWKDCKCFVSRGSLGEDAAYFNPECDASASLGLRIENISCATTSANSAA